MSLIFLIFVLILMGVGLWAFNAYVTKIDAKFKTLINWVVIIAAILLVLHAFGVFDLLNMQVPRVAR